MIFCGVASAAAEGGATSSVSGVVSAVTTPGT